MGYKSNFNEFTGVMNAPTKELEKMEFFKLYVSIFEMHFLFYLNQNCQYFERQTNEILLMHAFFKHVR